MTAVLESSQQSKTCPVTPAVDTDRKRPPAHVASEIEPRPRALQTAPVGIRSIQECVRPSEGLKV